MLRRLATLLLLSFIASAACACVVPATRYDEARSALKVEQEANRRGAAKLYQVEQQVAALQADLDKRQQKLDQQDRQIAAAQLDKNVANKQRDNASQLVDQLRGELARVGDNLRSFAEQKQKLSDALDDAEARAKRLREVEQQASERALVVRDLSLLLHDPISTGAVELTMVDGRPVLRMDSDKVLAPASILPGGQKLLSAVARVMALHKGSGATIRERNPAAGVSEEQETLRLRRLSDGLGAQGLGPERVTLDVDETKAGANDADTQDGSSRTAAAGQPAGTPSIEIEIATGASS